MTSPKYKSKYHSRFASHVVQIFSNVYNVQDVFSNNIEVLVARNGSVHLSERCSYSVSLINFLSFYSFL